MNKLNGEAGGWEQTKEKFEELDNGDGEEWLAEKESDWLETDQKISETKNRYNTDRSTYDRRFALRSTLLGAFVHGGVIHGSTEWTIQGRVVFNEEEFGPADLLVAESLDNGSIAILAVSSSEQEENVYERIQRLCHYISEEATAIEDRLGTSLDGQKVRGAIAINGISEEEVSRDEETAEIQGIPNTNPVGVWRFESSSERLSIVEWEEDDHPLGHKPDGGLGELLSGGQEIADTRHLERKHFHDSHHEKLFREFRNQVYDKHRSTDKDKQEFSVKELVAFLRQGHDQPTKSVATDRGESLIQWWKESDVIKRVENPDGYDEDSSVVYSFVNHSGQASIQDVDVEYRDGVRKALVRDRLRSKYVSEQESSSGD